MFNRLTSYVKNNKFKIIISNSYIDIINYEKIIVLDNNNIIIKTIDTLVTIKGDNLTVQKLLQDEILLTGLYKSIEFKVIN